VIYQIDRTMTKGDSLPHIDPDPVSQQKLCLIFSYSVSFTLLVYALFVIITLVLAWFNEKNVKKPPRIVTGTVIIYCEVLQKIISVRSSSVSAMKLQLVSKS